MTDLLTFIEATKGTSLKIEVTSKELLEFADALVERAAAKARAEIERQSDVEYIPKKEVIDLLGVCDATLWHWARSGYLVPVKLGRRVFYRRTDIQRLLNLSVMPVSTVILDLIGNLSCSIHPYLSISTFQSSLRTVEIWSR